MRPGFWLQLNDYLPALPEVPGQNSWFSLQDEFTLMNMMKETNEIVKLMFEISELRYLVV
jgi:hypothetical protein